MSDKPNESSLGGLLARLLQKDRENETLYPIPGLEIIKPIFSSISMHWSDIPLSVVGSASLNRGLLKRDPRDIDVMVHTENPEEFREIKHALEELSKRVGFRIDVFPAMYLDENRPYITFKNGAIIKDNSSPFP